MIAFVHIAVSSDPVTNCTNQNLQIFQRVALMLTTSRSRQYCIWK